MEEGNRQKKIGAVLQKDLAAVIQNMLRDAGHQNIIVSISKVLVTVDLSIAKVYVSVFPSNVAPGFVEDLNNNKPRIKHTIALKTKDQLRKMPDLVFFNDDSLDYIDKIDQAIKGGDDPLKKE